MPVNTTVTGADEVLAELNQLLDEFESDEFVTVGIHEDESQRDSAQINNATLGATHHFGAEIDHPGGTPYGYASQAAAERGEVRFLKRGEGFLVLGETEPHKIRIPARPWLDVGVETRAAEYAEIIAKGIEASEDLAVVLERVGLTAEAAARDYMQQLRTPPNARSTIERKGSSNPLIDSGALRQSVTSKVTLNRPEEGLD